MNRDQYIDVGVTRVARCYAAYFKKEIQPAILIVMHASGDPEGKQLYHVIKEDPYQIGSYQLMSKEEIVDMYDIDLAEETKESEVLKYLKEYDHTTNAMVGIYTSSYIQVIHVKQEELEEILLKTSQKPVDVNEFAEKVNFVSIMSLKYGLIILRKI